MPIGARLRLFPKLIRIGLTRFTMSKSGKKTESFSERLRMKIDDLKVGWSVAAGRSEDAQLQLLRTTLNQFHLEHGFHIYDFLARVPFVISGLKQLESGRIVDTEVRNIDIFPTLCRLLNLDVKDLPWHGASFAPQLESEPDHPMRMYMEVRGGAQATHAFYIRGVRAGQYKYAYTPIDKNAPDELFDLKADPNETNNIVDRHRDLADKLHEQAEAMAAAFQADGFQKQTSAKDQAATIEKLKSLGYM
jgi:arylsulfatase A-like enzyme